MIVDIIILIIIIVSSVIGKIRGFMKCLIGIASVALSIILALLFYRTIGNIIINNTEIDDKIKNTIVASIGVDDVEIKTGEELPKELSKYVEKANNEINDTKNGIQDGVAVRIAEEIIYAMSYIIIFIIIKIIAIILTIVAKIVEKLPVFQQINDIGGAICGLIQGVIIVYITISIISITSPLMKDSNVIKQIEESHIGKYIYNNNAFIKAIF